MVSLRKTNDGRFREMKKRLFFFYWKHNFTEQSFMKKTNEIDGKFKNLNDINSFEELIKIE